MNVTQTMEGERVDGVPVLAWMWQEETPLGPMPRLAFHWSTPPKNVAITRLVDAAALAAAPPAPVDEVRAKPLEWKGTEPHVFAYDEATGMGYEILRRNDGSFSLRKPGEGFVKSEIDNEEGLKRYCQSDYETRIRSALVSPPATSTDREAIIHRAEAAEARALAAEAERDRMRAALEPLAALAKAYDPVDEDEDDILWDRSEMPTVGMIRAARAALAQEPS